MQNQINKTSVIILFLSLLQVGSHCKKVVPPDYSLTPIFFIHGHGMKAEDWNDIISYLNEMGYPLLSLRTINLIPDDGSNVEAAENQIEAAIENFLVEVNNYIDNNQPEIPRKQKVDLISHSMGALSARWYAAKIRPERVRIWLSLGGANHGTNTLCKYSGQGAEDCCPAFAKDPEESFIQYELNGEPFSADKDETPFGIGNDLRGVYPVQPMDNRQILYLTVRTIPDEWIQPENSAVLDGAGGIHLNLPDIEEVEETSQGNYLIKKEIGHEGLLYSPRAVKFVNLILCHANEEMLKLK
jgi:pimeloyl-ACP methyl ester carboxylesterase